jgi:plastocyanin domain-containing protein/YHS domain-containing protein
MDVLLVDLAGLTLIAGIVWYFFLSRRIETGSAAAMAGVQDVYVTVKGGYSPELIVAQAELPLRIHFRREETAPCSEEIMFPDFGVRRALPAFETTVIELPAAKPGRYGFTCGMDMMHGTLQLGARPSSGMTAEVAASPEAGAGWPVDPLCGMKVDPQHPGATLEKDGKTVYFCHPACRDRFVSQFPA